MNRKKWVWVTAMVAMLAFAGCGNEAVTLTGGDAGGEEIVSGPMLVYTGTETEFERGTFWFGSTTYKTENCDSVIITVRNHTKDFTPDEGMKVLTTAGDFFGNCWVNGSTGKYDGRTAIPTSALGSTDSVTMVIMVSHLPAAGWMAWSDNEWISPPGEYQHFGEPIAAALACACPDEVTDIDVAEKRGTWGVAFKVLDGGGDEMTSFPSGLRVEWWDSNACGGFGPYYATATYTNGYWRALCDNDDTFGFKIQYGGGAGCGTSGNWHYLTGCLDSTDY